MSFGSIHAGIPAKESCFLAALRCRGRPKARPPAEEARNGEERCEKEEEESRCIPREQVTCEDGPDGPHTEDAEERHAEGHAAGLPPHRVRDKCVMEGLEREQDEPKGPRARKQECRGADREGHEEESSDTTEDEQGAPGHRTVGEMACHHLSDCPQSEEERVGSSANEGREEGEAPPVCDAGEHVHKEDEHKWGT